MGSLCFPYILVCCLFATISISKGQLGTVGDQFNCQGDPSNKYYSAPRNGDNGFQIKIDGVERGFEPEQEYIVTLQSTGQISFRGFALRAVATDNQAAGSFAVVNKYMAQVKRGCPNVATHVTNGKKSRVQVRWRASVSGCVQIIGSVIQKGPIWFKGKGGLTFNICVRNQTTSLAPNTTGCCACGTARYRMTFYGLWSPQSHPIDYPPYSTHWSNIVGASHSGNYIIWEYGGYASDGVQKVAEWGWVGNVESEIRAHTDDVLSVIKTKAQWPAYEPRNIREPPSDEFGVDQERHLVTALTMLGPSPDWNVGITKESMCTESCGWAGERRYDLVPWDAGTDNGVSYMSPNSPTDPHEPIRPLTTSDHPHSPFFNQNSSQIPPVARIIIRRLSISDDQCGDSEMVPEDNADVIETPISLGNVVPQPCMYAEWSNWSECGVTCGWGIKIRTRMVKFQPDSNPCEATMEKEICQGSDECEGGNDATICLYSDWTTWSACGLTCGASLRIRTRLLKWPSEERNCHDPLKEMLKCNLPPCGCSYSKWSEWMPCPVTCGFGQTIRKRSIESDNGNCSEPMTQTTQCLRSMLCDEETVEMRGCQYSPWSDWTHCPVTCGPGQTFRKRVLLRSAASSTCKGFQMENSKCMTSSSCLESCQYGDWSEWMPCSESCGVGSTLRKKFLIGSSDGNACQGFVMQRSACHNGPCDVQQISDCTFLPWSAWMPCSVTCGKGETLRKRFLNRTVSAENCLEFEMEKNRCMVSCDVSPVATQCTYTEWTQWMPCSSTCETFRKRALKIAPPDRYCKPFMMERRNCSSTECSRGTNTSRSEICEVSSWQPWGSCSVTCGRRGVATRTRQLLRSPFAPLSACEVPQLAQRKRCKPATLKCPRNCLLSTWSKWSKCNCTRRRHHGLQIRTRKRRSRARFNGRLCGPRKQKRTCVCPA
ncbi:unnamed protein product [Clavelina lepadiformis]|uniref:Spondin-1 n=1 Tax=Clavelina lepadiformis TaxID=159417 RepID=A0ABP0H0A7_CLALP